MSTLFGLVSSLICFPSCSMASFVSLGRRCGDWNKGGLTSSRRSPMLRRMGSDAASSLSLPPLGSTGTLAHSPSGVLISKPGWPGSWKRRVRLPKSL